MHSSTQLFRNVVSSGHSAGALYTSSTTLISQPPSQSVSTNPIQNPNTFELSFWQIMRYSICEIHYGGRATDELDRHLINAIGESYFCNERMFVNFPNSIKLFDTLTKNKII